MNPNPAPSSQPERRDWNQAKPDIIPEPTFWPAGVALAAMLCLWGFASSFVISGVGVCLFIVSLAGWIADIRYERRQQHGPIQPSG